MFDAVVEQKLSRNETRGHDHPGTEPSKESAEAGLLSEHSEPVGHRALRAMPFVNLREQRVRWLACVAGGRVRLAMECTYIHVKSGLTWLRIAAAKPARMPLPRLMESVAALLRLRFVSSVMLRYATSWQNSLTVNCPIA